MRYLGGKSRFWKHIVPLFGDLREKVYVEPFVGGASVISNVVAARRIANDVHPHLIQLLRAVAEGWTPPTSLSLSEWRECRDRARKGDLDPLVGFAGFCCSYGARWFEGYARKTRGETDSPVAAIAARQLAKQAPLLAGIEWHCGSYDQLDIPSGAVIYCDPPYKNTKGYSGTAKFDHDAFYSWCLTQHMEKACTVYLSEQAAPEEWTELWELERSTGLDQDGDRKTVTERLFTLD